MIDIFLLLCVSVYCLIAAGSTAVANFVEAGTFLTVYARLGASNLKI